jgi:hypothetical protein
MRVKELLIATRLCSTPLDCNRLLLLLLLLHRLRVLKIPLMENGLSLPQTTQHLQIQVS